MSDDTMPAPAWIPLFSTSTSWDELQAIIATRAQVEIDDLRAQLETDPELSAAQRAALVAWLTPRCHAATRAALERGWRRLQAEARPTSVTVQ